jgi:hypothetical protein
VFLRVTSRAGSPARWLSIPLAVGALGAGAWLAFAPLESSSRDALFQIPKGTWARRMSGDPVEILPSEVRLTLGIRDVLVLENLDEVPQIFGPALLMPGQSFRLPFEMAASYQFACTAHASGQMTVTVEPLPDSPWARLRWRVNELLRSRHWGWETLQG